MRLSFDCALCLASVILATDARTEEVQKMQYSELRV